jgi:hypothetical protein
VSAFKNSRLDSCFLAAAETPGAAQSLVPIFLEILLDFGALIVYFIGPKMENGALGMTWRYRNVGKAREQVPDKR